MAKITTPKTYDYEGWLDVGEKKIGHNTYVTLEGMGEGNPPVVCVGFHHTDVVRFYADGVIVLDSGGWQTVTTKDRMNAVLPQNVRVYQDKRVWYVDTQDAKAIPFSDGMKVR